MKKHTLILACLACAVYSMGVSISDKHASAIKGLGPTEVEAYIKGYGANITAQMLITKSTLSWNAKAKDPKQKKDTSAEVTMAAALVAKNKILTIFWGKDWKKGAKEKYNVGISQAGTATDINGNKYKVTWQAAQFEDSNNAKLFVGTLDKNVEGITPYVLPAAQAKPGTYIISSTTAKIGAKSYSGRYVGTMTLESAGNLYMSKKVNATSKLESELTQIGAHKNDWGAPIFYPGNDNKFVLAGLATDQIKGKWYIARGSVIAQKIKSLL